MMEDLAITPEELENMIGVDTGDAEGSPLATSGHPAANPSRPAVTARPARFAPLQPADSVPSSTNLGLLLGVTLQIAVELGRTKMSIEEVLKLGPGSVVDLDKLAGEPVDVLVNDRLIAQGEVVVIEDRFGVRITNVLPPAQRINSLR